jgi:hypothetical protein
VVHRLSRTQGFHVHATDGSIGHIDDFLVDERLSRVCFLMVDTSNWLGGKWVGVSPESVASIDWGNQVVNVNLTRNEITIDQNKPVELDPIAVHNDDQPFQEVNVVTEYVHVPVEVPCDDDDGGGCCSECNAKPRARLDYGVLALAVLVVLLRRRR